MKGFKIALLIIACIAMVSCKKTEKTTETTADNKQENTSETVIEAVPDDRGYIVSVGDQAPDFKIEYLDGSVVNLSDLKGKLVMIQFTASWCSVCRKEMPFIEKDIWQKYKDNPDFVLIGIDLKEDKETTAKFAKDIKVTYPITLDPEGNKFALFTAPKAGVTRNIIIDKNGNIVLLTRLFEMEEFNKMVKFIDDYLKNN